ncbi:MAG: nuclear transport factor 2 family protein [Bacteroidales bacterium]|nr:nuclear transport factor 2 family protein [Bacteroidales bacterium]
MTDIVALTRAWLDHFAEGNFDTFPGDISPDFRLRLPFLPAGMQNEFCGRETARAVLVASAERRSKLIFEDVNILRTEDPELVVTTARAQATLDDGSIYRNEYIMLTRIRDGVVLEHIEYLNPLAVTASMSG